MAGFGSERFGLASFSFEPGPRQLYQRQVEVATGTGCEELAGRSAGISSGGFGQLPHHDVELRLASCERPEPGVAAQAAIELEGGRPALLQPLCKVTIRLKRKQPLRGPERDRGRTGPGTLQADLAQVQLLRREVGIGRIVLVEPADSGIAEEHAAAAIGL